MYLSLSKIVYLPLCLLLILIPKEKFKTVKDRHIILFSIITISIIINLLWLSIVFSFPSFRDGINSLKQLKYIYSNIFEYIGIIFMTYFTNGFNMLLEEFSKVLGLFTVYLSNIYIYI